MHLNRNRWEVALEPKGVFRLVRLDISYRAGAQSQSEKLIPLSPEALIGGMQTGCLLQGFSSCSQSTTGQQCIQDCIHMGGFLFINIISVKVPAKRWNRENPLWRWKMWFCPHAKTHPHSCGGRIYMSALCVTIMVAQSLLQSIVWLFHNYSHECCGVI